MTDPYLEAVYQEGRIATKEHPMNETEEAKAYQAGRDAAAEGRFYHSFPSFINTTSPDACLAAWRKGWGEIIRERAKEEAAAKAKPDPVDPVNHPAHYTSLGATCTCGKPIECIQVAEHMGFRLGNAMKYLFRCGKKGSKVEDLRKAIWYIEREIAMMEEGEKV